MWLIFTLITYFTINYFIFLHELTKYYLIVVQILFFISLSISFVIIKQKLYLFIFYYLLYKLFYLFNSKAWELTIYGKHKVPFQADSVAPFEKTCYRLPSIENKRTKI